MDYITIDIEVPIITAVRIAKAAAVSGIYVEEWLAKKFQER